MVFYVDSALWSFCLLYCIKNASISSIFDYVCGLLQYLQIQTTFNLDPCLVVCVLVCPVAKTAFEGLCRYVALSYQIPPAGYPRRGLFALVVPTNYKLQITSNFTTSSLLF